MFEVLEEPGRSSTRRVCSVKELAGTLIHGSGELRFTFMEGTGSDISSEAARTAATKETPKHRRVEFSHDEHVKNLEFSLKRSVFIWCSGVMSAQEV